MTGSPSDRVYGSMVSMMDHRALIYVACPSRMISALPGIRTQVARAGKACLDPFAAFPYESFEGNQAIGRQQTLEWCCRLVDVCDEFWIFGLSHGTLTELEHFLTHRCGRELVVSLPRHDPEKPLAAEIARRFPMAAHELLANIQDQEAERIGRLSGTTCPASL